MPVRVFADSMPKYVCEVKIFFDSYENAQKEGYNILTDKANKIVDINQNAGGGIGSEGDRKVYFGYKTTNDRKDAITDLALLSPLWIISFQQSMSIVTITILILKQTDKEPYMFTICSTDLPMTTAAVQALQYGR